MLENRKEEASQTKLKQIIRKTESIKNRIKKEIESYGKHQEKNKHFKYQLIEIEFQFAEAHKRKIYLFNNKDNMKKEKERILENTQKQHIKRRVSKQSLKRLRQKYEDQKNLVAELKEKNKVTKEEKMEISITIREKKVENVLLSQEVRVFERNMKIIKQMSKEILNSNEKINKQIEQKKNSLELMRFSNKQKKKSLEQIQNQNKVLQNKICQQMMLLQKKNTELAAVEKEISQNNELICDGKGKNIELSHRLRAKTDKKQRLKTNSEAYSEYISSMKETMMQYLEDKTDLIKKYEQNKGKFRLCSEHSYRVLLELE